MKKNVTDAVARLQARLRHSTSHWAVERNEEALNLLLNQPNNPAPPSHQIRNALGEASYKLANRARLFKSFTERALRNSSPQDGLGILRLELADFINRDIGGQDAILLRIAMAGGSAQDIARVLGISVDRARERLSRARARAWPRWLN